MIESTEEVIRPYTVPLEQPLQKRLRLRVWFFVGLVLVVIVVAGSFAAWKLHAVQLLRTRYNQASVVLTVRDTNKLPIDGAVVTLGTQHFTTNASGQIQVASILAGSYQLTVSKSGFGKVKTSISLHRHSNPLQLITLNALPAQLYTVHGYVQDSLSGKPITNVQVQLGTQTVLTNPNGEFDFAQLPPSTISLQLSAGGYTSQTLSETISDKDLIISPLPLVPAGQVIFDSNRNGLHGIYTVNLDGSDAHRLIAAGAGEDFSPLTSPDGLHFVFASTRDGLKDPSGNPLKRLYIATSSGQNVQAVGTVEATTFQPIWSPNSQFVYLSGYTDTSLSTSAHVLYSVATSSGVDLGDAVTNLVFSPDSTTVAYTALGTASDGSAVYQLKTYTIATGAKHILASAAAAMMAVRYSTDGTTLSYQVLQNTSIQRYQVALATGIQTTTPAISDATRLYTVSPDATLQAFVDTPGGQSNLFIVDRQDANQQQLTMLGTVDPLFQPVWDPSGRYLIFATNTSGVEALNIVALAGGGPHLLTDYSPN